MRFVMVAAVVWGVAGHARAEDGTGAPSDTANQFVPFSRNTMGIATAFPTGGANLASFRYFFRDRTALNVHAGITVATFEDVAAMQEVTVYAATALVGVRRYLRPRGRVHLYAEPALLVAAADFKAFSDSFTLGLAGLFGVELKIFEQFTIGPSIGMSLRFSDRFSDVNFGLLTTSIEASFYW